jgi:predicted N-acetyltransferase YhbS
MLETRIVRTQELSSTDKQKLNALLDSAFANDDFGRQYQWGENDWNVLLETETEIVSHVGVVDRTILAGSQPVRVGGVGGVATAPAWQRRGYAQQLMRSTAAFMRDQLHMSAGLLICGDKMLPYYSRLGWQAVPGPLVVDQPQGKVMMPTNIMVLPFSETPWPAGTIDLCSLPW